MKKTNVDVLKELVTRGDEVVITQGRLVIHPASGKPVPGWWMKESEKGLVETILDALRIEAYKFIDFSTGFYGQNRQQGMTLRFISLSSASQAYAI